MMAATALRRRKLIKRPQDNKRLKLRDAGFGMACLALTTLAIYCSVVLPDYLRAAPAQFLAAKVLFYFIGIYLLGASFRAFERIWLPRPRASRYRRPKRWGRQALKSIELAAEPLSSPKAEQTAHIERGGEFGTFVDIKTYRRTYHFGWVLIEAIYRVLSIIFMFVGIVNVLKTLGWLLLAMLSAVDIGESTSYIASKFPTLWQDLGGAAAISLVAVVLGEQFSKAANACEKQRGAKPASQA